MEQKNKPEVGTKEYFETREITYVGLKVRKY